MYKHIKEGRRPIAAKKEAKKGLTHAESPKKDYNSKVKKMWSTSMRGNVVK